MKRRGMSLLLAVVLLLSMTGCIFSQGTQTPTTTAAESTSAEPTTPQETEPPKPSMSELFHLTDRAHFNGMEDVYVLSSLDAILEENETPECGCDFVGIIGGTQFVLRIFNYGGAEETIDFEQYLVYDPVTCKVTGKLIADGYVSVTQNNIILYKPEEKKVLFYDASIEVVGEYAFEGFSSSYSFIGGAEMFPLYTNDYENDTVYRVTAEGDTLVAKAISMPGYDNYAYGCSADGTILTASHVEPTNFRMEAYVYDVTTGKDIGTYTSYEADWLHDTLELGENFVIAEYLIPDTTVYAAVLMDKEYKLQLVLWDATATLEAGKTLDTYEPKKENEDEEDPLQIPEGTMSEYAELYKRADEFFDLYGVHMYIADRIPEEMGGFHVVPLWDQEELERMMNAIDRILGAYPSNFIEQLMVGSVEEIDIFISNGVTATEEGLLQVAGGFATTIGKHRVIVIDLTTDEVMYDKMNHEIMHLIETRLNEAAVYIPGFGYGEEGWFARNPANFEYSNDYPNYSDYEPFYENYDWFVSSYSTVNKGEDMAEIYGSAMYGYFMQGEDVYVDVKEKSRLNAKLDYLCDYIRASFDTTGWAEVEPWEIFVSDN